MMEAALLSLLVDHEPITTAVPIDNIVWALLPQGHDRPSIALHLITGSRGLTTTGPDRLRTEMVQIDVWALDYLSARQISDLIEARLSGYADATLPLVALRNMRSGTEMPGSELFHRISTDYEVWSVA